MTVKQQVSRQLQITEHKYSIGVNFSQIPQHCDIFYKWLSRMIKQ